MSVSAYKGEVSTYGRKKCSFSREIAGTAVWCPLMGGVHIAEVSVSRSRFNCILDFTGACHGQRGGVVISLVCQIFNQWFGPGLCCFLVVS